MGEGPKCVCLCVDVCVCVSPASPVKSSFSTSHPAPPATPCPLPPAAALALPGPKSPNTPPSDAWLVPPREGRAPSAGADAAPAPADQTDITYTYRCTLRVRRENTYNVCTCTYVCVCVHTASSACNLYARAKHLCHCSCYYSPPICARKDALAALDACLLPAAAASCCARCALVTALNNITTPLKTHTHTHITYASHMRTCQSTRTRALSAQQHDVARHILQQRRYVHAQWD